jgi:hypothetical protein
MFKTYTKAAMFCFSSAQKAYVQMYDAAMGCSVCLLGPNHDLRSSFLKNLEFSTSSLESTLFKPGNTRCMFCSSLLLGIYLSNTLHKSDVMSISLLPWQQLFPFKNSKTSISSLGPTFVQNIVAAA